MVRIDLHTHSEYSKDSRSSIDEIIRAVSSSRLHGIALTDHNELEGALELKKRAPFVVIPGEEIKTTAGEIIGLFLSERIPPGLSPLETIERIREQCALVYIPHPFDRVRGSRMETQQLDAITESIDVLEVFNARNALPRFNRRAQEYAQSHGLRAGAGSDAHTCAEYGSAFVDMDRFDDAQGFLDAMRAGQWQGRLSPPWVHFKTRIDVIQKRRASRTAAPPRVDG